MTMGDRIVVMKDGIVQQIATPKDIYNHPANRFVASFIGAPPMNFMDARLESEGESVRLRGASLSLLVNGAAAQRLRDAKTQDVTLGVRPEDVVLRGPGAGVAAAGAIPVRVDVVETLGAEQHLSLSAGENTFLARVAADFPARIGDQLSAQIADAKLHVFDRESGIAYA